MSEIRAFVGNAHGDVVAVRAALADDPTLADASWDSRLEVAAAGDGD